MIKAHSILAIKPHYVITHNSHFNSEALQPLSEGQMASCPQQMTLFHVANTWQKRFNVQSNKICYSAINSWSNDLKRRHLILSTCSTFIGAQDNNLPIFLL